MLETHTGDTIDAIRSVWLDEEGNVLIESQRGVGAVHDQDLEFLLPLFCDERGSRLDEDALSVAITHLGTRNGVPLRFRFGADLLPVLLVSHREVPERFAFVREPVPAPDELACA